MDVEAKVSSVASPIVACSQQDVELICSQIWIVSASANQLPLQIEDASRPEKADVRYRRTTQFYCEINCKFNRMKKG